MKRIDVLPDDVLIEIFDFYICDHTRIEAWQSLVHVCRRWRSLVLGSPRHLDLRLYCTPETSVRDRLDVWPAFPLIVEGNTTLSSDTDNVIAALGQSNRVCEVSLDLAGWQLEKVLAAMQVPFPELAELHLILRGEILHGETVPVIPDSILGGSAPLGFIELELEGIPFPGLPKLLLSATHLVNLNLFNIPHSGYISPKAMATCLSVLSSLEQLILEFRSPQSRPHRETRSLPPPKRSILPTLRRLQFRGVTEYLEELVIHIDTPQIDRMHITFFNQIDFDCPRLAQFINRTPELCAFDEALVQFDDDTAGVTLRCRTSESGLRDLEIAIACREPDWQLSSIEQVCNSSFHRLSIVEDLFINHQYSQLVWKNDAIENDLWLELLLPFTAVGNLYLCKEFAPGIASSLHELVGGRVTEVLPSLQNILVEGLETSGPFQENIGQFVTARQLSNHPVAISDWDED